MLRSSHARLCGIAAAGLLMTGLAINLAGCERNGTFSRPDATHHPRSTVRAIPQDAATPLGQALRGMVQANPGKSGFRYLDTGTESLQYRLALIQAAAQSIDLQYYTIHDDLSANLLLEALLQAAERGVRVRFLIDNISMDEVGYSLTVLNDIKNIEIRIFNPSSTRHQSIAGQIVSKISHINKIFKRMHNKALIADNQLAIIGGRNLGDEYFEAHSDSDFKDADIVTAGPITAKISQSFDAYWNDENTFPINDLRKPAQSGEEVKRLRAELKEQWDKESRTRDGQKTLHSGLSKRLKEGEIHFIWAPAELLADNPEKVDHSTDHAKSKPLSRLEQMAANARSEFIIVSPYFVPQDDGVEWLIGMARRGVAVRILTNSLASTDVVAVHTGYRRYRETLLKGGIELYEFKPVGDGKPRQRLFGTTAPATASLHAKAYVVDRASVLIGSFNLDPRSESLNTETAIAVHHPVIAAQVAKMFGEATAPASSYKLTLEKDGGILWTTQENGAIKTYRNEPEGGWRNIQAFFMGLLPLEDQL